MATTKELREMSDEQVLALMKESRQTLFRLRVQSQTERLDVPSEIKRNRRLIARVKTIQTERLTEIAAAKSASARTQVKK